eukprot:6184292-Pleurochrysis_carterae.AAC.3
MKEFYTKLQRRLPAVQPHNMARNPICIMVFNIRGSRHHVEHCCRSDAFDRSGCGGYPIYPSISIYCCKRLLVTHFKGGPAMSWLPYLSWTLLPSFNVMTYNAVDAFHTERGRY